MRIYRSGSLVVLLTGILCIVISSKANAQNKEEFDNLIFFIPQGLSIIKSTTSMKLTDAAGEEFSITINKSSFSLKKMEKSLPVYWKESLAMDGFDDSIAGPQFVRFKNNGGWDCFRGGKLISYSAQTAPQYYHLTVVRYLGITTRIITKANSEEQFMKKMAVLMELISSIEFKKPQQNSPGNTGISNQ